MKIGVTGAAGMLGTAVLARLSREHFVMATSRTPGYMGDRVQWQTFDITNESRLIEWLTVNRPDVVIHCAALVDIDACQDEPETAYAVHVRTTEVIAAVLQAWEGRQIYISTDSVFNGESEGLYTENDEPGPQNIYALTKRKGEIVALGAPKGTVLRTNIFGWNPSKRPSFAEWVFNGLNTGARLTMFADVTYTPIHVAHLSEAIAAIIDTSVTGLFHATGSASLSKYDFAVRMAAVFGFDTQNLVRASIDDARFKAPRPRNMALSNAKLCAALGYRLPDVDSGILVLKSQYDTGWAARIKAQPANV